MGRIRVNDKYLRRMLPESRYLNYKTDASDGNYSETRNEETASCCHTNSRMRIKTVCLTAFLFLFFVLVTQFASPSYSSLLTNEALRSLAIYEKIESLQSAGVSEMSVPCPREDVLAGFSVKRLICEKECVILKLAGIDESFYFESIAAGNFSFDFAAADISECDVNGKEAFMFTDEDGFRNIIWLSGTAVCRLVSQDILTDETLRAAAENITGEIDTW